MVFNILAAIGALSLAILFVVALYFGTMHFFPKWHYEEDDHE